jgi:hypothetical protein
MRCGNVAHAQTPRLSMAHLKRCYTTEPDGTSAQVPMRIGYRGLGTDVVRQCPELVNGHTGWGEAAFASLVGEDCYLASLFASMLFKNHVLLHNFGELQPGSCKGCSNLF